VWVRVKGEVKSGNFAEVSREIGNQWRQLADSDKQVYEDKARRINEENTRKWAEEQRAEDDRPPHLIHIKSESGTSGPALTPQQSTSQGHPSVPPVVKPMEPIFHAVPPRPQRLLHSEAFLRYIEGLTADSQTMSNWEKQLNSTKDTTKTDEARLPAHWLADNGDHGTSLDALWALRDFMMCDSLGLAKIL